MSPPPPPHQPPQQPPHQPPPPPQQPPQQQPQPQPQPQYYPYPYPYPYPPPRSKPTSKPFTSCILATFFLTLFLLASAITLYILFRPQNPNISIKTLKFPSFTPHNNTATLSFTFLQLASVHNPNRYAFSHHGSQFELVSSSVGPLGSMYIPAGQIAGQRSKLVSAQFDVKDFSVQGDVMELESMMRLVGSVKVVQVFAHHVEETVRCRVSVRVADGSILGYHC